MHSVSTWLRETVGPQAQLWADSRRVAAGDAFLAFAGARHDARDHIAELVRRGAAAVVWESEGFEWDPAWAVPNRAVQGLKQLAGEIASGFYGEPSRWLRAIGVTGTSGKTTVTLWLAQALFALGRPCALAGTLGVGFFPKLVDTGLTTPDAVGLQRALSDLLRQGAQAVAMEVSSIGLVEGRVQGMYFDTAVFTNLSHDHLDYHGDMSTYASAKEILFNWAGLKCAVINVDDALGVRLAQRCVERGLEVWTYSAAGGAADLSARAIEQSVHGLRFEVHIAGRAHAVQVPFYGRYNVANLLAVLGGLLAGAHPLDAALAALTRLTPVPGRLEPVPSTRPGPLVLVDYAHKPDALEQTLAACRSLVATRGGKLHVIFGCGGERDSGKRAPMGKIAVAAADSVTITSDNPRGEDPDAIIQAIVSGIDDKRTVRIEPDRARAIVSTLAEARDSDLVLIAGKGHESYQEVLGVKHPFSDIAVARSALENRS